MESSKTFSRGRLKEEKCYNSGGRLHGECKYYYNHGAESPKDISYMVKHYKSGTVSRLIKFRLNGTKESESIYDSYGWACETIKYDEWERNIKVMGSRYSDADSYSYFY